MFSKPTPPPPRPPPIDQIRRETPSEHCTHRHVSLDHEEGESDGGGATHALSAVHQHLPCKRANPGFTLQGQNDERNRAMHAGTQRVMLPA